MDALAKELTLEQIPEGLYREIAEAIGVENLVKLTQLVGGSTIYLPKTESVVRPVRDARIREEFNGYNHMELAKKYDVTERWVRQLCGDGHAEGQLSLFDLPGPGDEKAV
ncbi:Mor transcription activator domain protein [Syntrophobotulus glycolicus DSM 8271]|uniref:Mor transcription activator domain protein n=1 Tax=Syntrophobotulus glycolicus (strain DSM 8271 / FlGlyR) TaxID=645991 RepID=F0SX47_SYNGF|nr:Mor transcription activator family protein [Syntrophobotulus glycolicus]ADY54895.1 Mor transcription activator domain protein [Syntrophobotulus glycolicus DSM 8271]ADY56907.1 Mor transcription activator domain protein [Syntrophobotulus glycolicus DSM 8271]ADY57244.1 Mor transcription activator domain protein [Syntrophobotulus glycolicus DSM 8271]ADY57416.1 Mor transcription activator domain protein [Syntrophobotulus glycolicus DSM 8271]